MSDEHRQRKDLMDGTHVGNASKFLRKHGLVGAHIEDIVLDVDNVGLGVLIVGVVVV